MHHDQRQPHTKTSSCLFIWTVRNRVMETFWTWWWLHNNASLLKAAGSYTSCGWRTYKFYIDKAFFTTKITRLIWLSHMGGIICGVKHGPPAFRQASDCIGLSMWLPQLQDSLLIQTVVLHLVDKKHYCPCPAPLEAPCVTTRHLVEHLHLNFPVSQIN